MMMMTTKALKVLTLCPVLHVLYTDTDTDLDIHTDKNIDTDY